MRAATLSILGRKAILRVMSLLALGAILAISLLSVNNLPLFAQTDEDPSNLNVELSEGWVVLKWRAPAKDTETVTGYQVLRRQSGVDALLKFAVIQDDTGSVETTWMDATADPARRSVRVPSQGSSGERIERSKWGLIRLPADYVEPAELPAFTSAPEPTATAEPEPTATATPEATATAVPTPTPTAPPIADFVITGFSLVSGGSDDKLMDLVDGSTVFGTRLWHE